MILGKLYPGEAFVWLGSRGAVLEQGMSVHAIMTNPVRKVWLAPETEVERARPAVRVYFRNLAHHKGTSVVEYMLHVPRTGKTLIE